METDIGGPGGDWASTLWSTALHDRKALEQLATRYWKPVYFYIRAKGKDVETAKDLTQGFFAHLFEKGILERKNESGSFRAFLRGVLDRFLSDQYDRERAMKRGGDIQRISLDFAEAETEFATRGCSDPEKLFERSCAAETLARVLERMRAERVEGYEILRLRFGLEGEASDYAEIAQRLELSEFLKKRGLVSRESIEIVWKIAQAVEYAHAKGVLHRDLKPANVMVDRACEPKVLDFGIAKSMSTHSGVTTTGSALGTPPYMSPEQAAGAKNLDARADVYSLGAILYEVLTGRPPHTGETAMEVYRKIATEEPARPSKAPRDLQVICLKALEKDKRNRYESAKALAEDLRRYLDGRPIAARPTTAVLRFARFVRRHAATFLLSTVLAATLGGLAWMAKIKIANPFNQFGEALRNVHQPQQGAQDESNAFPAVSILRRDKLPQGFHPGTFSPDRKHLLGYVCKSDESYEYWLADAHGANARLLCACPARRYKTFQSWFEPNAFSPEGDRVAVLAAREKPLDFSEVLEAWSQTDSPFKSNGSVLLTALQKSELCRNTVGIADLSGQVAAIPWDSLAFSPAFGMNRLWFLSFDVKQLQWQLCAWDGKRVDVAVAEDCLSPSGSFGVPVSMRLSPDRTRAAVLLKTAIPAGFYALQIVDLESRALLGTSPPFRSDDDVVLKGTITFFWDAQGERVFYNHCPTGGKGASSVEYFHTVTQQRKTISDVGIAVVGVVDRDWIWVLVTSTDHFGLMRLSDSALIEVGSDSPTVGHGTKCAVYGSKDRFAVEVEFKNP